MKTPEEMAEEYADSRLSGNETYEYGMRQGFLAGYQAAKDTYKDAIDTYEDVAKQMLEEAVRIMSPKDQLADTSKEMNSPEKPDSCEHILDMEKMVDANFSSGWISVKDRLPDIYQRVLILIRGRVFISSIEEEYGDEYRDGVITFWDGDWDWPEVTHWMPLPEAPKEES